MKLNILYVGPRDGTCLQRANALASLGHRVQHVESAPPAGPGLVLQAFRIAKKLGWPFDPQGANREILRRLEDAPDVLWIDKGVQIRAATLAKVRARNPRPLIVAYSPDDMLNPMNQSRHYLGGVGLYDLHVTTKSFHLSELRELGAADVLFVDNAYDPDVHRPLELSAEDRGRFAADLSFVGANEPDRARQMLELARDGYELRVWGPRWHSMQGAHPRLHAHDEWLDRLEYSKAVNAAKVSLGFLRKASRDLQTTRSIEIPACGGFMLAERTEEHLRLFEEGREAEFFGSYEELREKCGYYLEHDDERRRIAAAGLRRCIDGGYSNQDRLSSVLDYLRQSHGLGETEAAVVGGGETGDAATRDGAGPSRSSRPVESVERQRSSD